ncbi:MAG: hypothetical protein A3G27_09875 [Betaproteobacteria bacterium RIFCSPLOWO2_12_FULL_66_14]|nr:MAG: hypothetical protein A3G27_09875 [Betaproteobacteria bacterium RIFCSPLOWO2_12_FULL_66_14]
MFTRRQFLLTSAAGAASTATGLVSRALAQEKLKQATIVVGVPAGGATDVLARIHAEGLRLSYAHSVIVENRPGAGGSIALEYVKNARPDGSVLFFTPAYPIIVSPHVSTNLPYDTLRDLVPVGVGARSMLAFAVGPSVPASVKTLAEYVQWCKTNPKQLLYGAQNGSSQHFAGMLFARSSGLSLQNVSYKGGAPIIQDLLGGHLPASISPVAEAIPHHKSGKLRVLAVTGARRSRFLPEVPSMQELGHKAVLFQDWLGMFAPAKTPMEQVNRINAAMAQAVRSEHGAAGLARMGIEPEIVPADRFAAMVKADWERYRSIVQTTGFKATLQDQFK